MSTHEWQIVNNEEEFKNFMSQLLLGSTVAVDTETKGQRPGQPNYLLGMSVTGKLPDGNYKSIYCSSPTSGCIRSVFSSPVVGWNVPFDKAWLDHTFGLDTKWHADARIMWHLSNNDPTIRGFGLKKAQKLLLGWSESNDKELEENVRRHGGKLSNGDHYLADLPVLAKYACLDTYSTLLCFEQLEPFFKLHDYWHVQQDVLNYAIELNKASAQGLPVSESELMSAAALYKNKRETARLRILEVCTNEIEAVERAWLARKMGSLKTPRGREAYLLNSVRHRRFNPSSAHQRALLLHTMLEFPVKERTEKGLPKTDRANISLIKHPSAEALLQYSEAKKVVEQAKTYLGAVQDGRMYTNYDVCGTVSGRLSGFRPSVLNMPFEESEVMSAFKCEDGYVGIHADLASIEPCVLAYYSEDPTLLKVYREGMGDIYLDLALDLFPNNEELKKGYNPNVPVTSEVKRQFKDVRSICKTIHLAVSYTGTYITVAKNLTKNGYPTTKGQAMALVKQYWSKFQRVRAFDRALQERYEVKGNVRNIVGRIVQVPDQYKKDLMNRLIQSSAHDVLRVWVEEIINQFTLNGVEWKHWLPDLHDSTTFMIKQGQEELARQCYIVALKLVETRLELTVPLGMELKFCKTLAGVKANE